MNWNPNQEPHMQDEYRYGSYTGTPQQLHYTGERAYYEQQQHTGYYQPEQNYQYVVYNQFQPLPTSQPLNLGSVAAILSYAGGWFTGLLFLLFAGQNRYVRFHALQSLIFFGAINLLDIGLFNLAMFGHHHFHYITAIALFAFFLLNIVAFFGWLIAMIQAARGRYYKLPFVGAFVEQYLNRHVIVK